MTNENTMEIVDRDSGGVMIEREQAKAIQEVQASLVIAQRFPRSEPDALVRIRSACQRPALADKAIYVYPRGGKKVEGPSIRLAEALARAWGNMTYGIRELEQQKGFSVVESYCWDLETNTKASRSFTVNHKIRLKDGSDKILTDPRDIYEMVANYGQRRTRACILEIIPSDVIEQAVDWCNQTMRDADNGNKAVPLADRIREMVLAFNELAVTTEMIEKFLGHKVEQAGPGDMVDLKKIFLSIREGASKREDWFDFKTPNASGKAAEINALLKKPESEAGTKTEEKPAAPMKTEQGEFDKFKGDPLGAKKS